MAPADKFQWYQTQLMLEELKEHAKMQQLLENFKKDLKDKLPQDLSQMDKLPQDLPLKRPLSWMDARDEGPPAPHVRLPTLRTNTIYIF